MTYLYVAVGGALGAMARYGVGAMALALFGMAFPYGTLIVNVLGSFVMGALIEIFARLWNPGGMMQIMLTTGFLGAFTTFSTFSLDTITLYQRGDMALAIGYVLLSVGLSLTAVFAGLYAVRSLIG